MPITRDTPLHLRPWSPDDVKAVIAAFATPDMDNQAPMPIRDADTAAKWLEWPCGMRQRPAGFAFAVCGSDDVPVGNVAVSGIDNHDVGWVSYWTAASVRGQRVATDALIAVVDWVHDQAEVERLELGHRVNNPSSGRVAELAGFIQEGIERGKLRYDGKRFDVARWGRLNDDPRPTSGRPISLHPPQE